jgi:hypothetical protein
LRTLRVAIASVLSKKGFEEMKTFLGELNRVIQGKQTTPGDITAEELRANRRAAAEAARMFGAS